LATKSASDPRAGKVGLERAKAQGNGFGRELIFRSLLAHLVERAASAGFHLCYGSQNDLGHDLFLVVGALASAG
jgi:hypothetical protein